MRAGACEGRGFAVIIYLSILISVFVIAVMAAIGLSAVLAAQLSSALGAEVMVTVAELLGRHGTAERP